MGARISCAEIFACSRSYLTPSCSSGTDTPVCALPFTCVACRHFRDRPESYPRPAPIGGSGTAVESQIGGLFGNDGFHEIAGIVHVAAVEDREVVGEKLERDNFENGEEQLGRR